MLEQKIKCLCVFVCLCVLFVCLFMDQSEPKKKIQRFREKNHAHTHIQTFEQKKREKRYFHTATTEKQSVYMCAKVFFYFFYRL